MWYVWARPEIAAQAWLKISPGCKARRKYGLIELAVEGEYWDFPSDHVLEVFGFRASPTGDINGR